MTEQTGVDAAVVTGTRHACSGGLATVKVVKPGIFDASALQTADRGAPLVVDFRLSRNATLHAWKSGELTRHQICDAQYELIRTATHCGELTRRRCPICVEDEVSSPLKEVTYVFGPRLPKQGRCISRPGELEEFQLRKRTFSAYVVEVCLECNWNHIMRRMLLGGNG